MLSPEITSLLSVVLQERKKKKEGQLETKKKKTSLGI